ncbi:MAG: acetyl-CoA carboxylase biotin carboxyl carrier protein [Alphaproteobacteria bacterium]
MNIDTKIIAELAEILDNTNLTELEIETETGRVCLTRQSIVASSPVVASAPVGAPVAAPIVAAPVVETSAPAVVDLSKNPNVLKSPIVGVVYLSSEPSAPDYVKVGSEVKEGDTVCLIEAMKTFNPVKAHKSGKVTQILIETGAPAEYNEPLMVIE